MASESSGERIAVFGLGYVGCVTAACLASLGHRVIGVDKDEFKVRAVNDGRAPFHEPGLAEIVRTQVREGRLSATTDAAQVVSQTSLALLCVGTPSERNGNLSTQQLERVSAELASALRARPADYVVAVRSTVFPGTCDGVVAPHFSGLPVAVVANPEFLREGCAIRDFQKPSLLVVGGHDRAAVERVAGLYRALPVDASLVSLRTAELIKYACNAFHAVKISFANEIGALAGALGIDGNEVMATLCRDTVLNVSPAYLTPGFAFGGSCLPKDLRALAHRASRLDLDLPLLASALPSNEAHLARAVQTALDLPFQRLGVYGLAFKADTDDVRESPVVAMLERLIGKGRELRVFDPAIRLEAIYGSNQNFLLAHIPHIGRLLCGSLEELTGWAEAVIVAQTPGPEVRRQLDASGLTLIDLVGGGGAARPTASRTVTA